MQFESSDISAWIHFFDILKTFRSLHFQVLFLLFESYDHNRFTNLHITFLAIKKAYPVPNHNFKLKLQLKYMYYTWIPRPGLEHSSRAYLAENLLELYLMALEGINTDYIKTAWTVQVWNLIYPPRGNLKSQLD